MVKKTNYNNALLLLLLIIVITILYKIYKKQTEYFQNKYTLNDIYLYIFSWKRVNNNAIQIYNKVAPIIPNTFFINCDENFNAAAYIPANNLIQLDDSYYFGGQFETAMKHCPHNKIYANIVGDVDPNKINWNNLFDSMLYGINNLNAGVIAPDAPNFPKLGPHIKNSYYEVADTDSTIIFITPEIWHPYKNFPYKQKTHYGHGIDKFFCNITRRFGKKTVRDKEIQVDTDGKAGYDGAKAAVEMHSFLEAIEKYTSPG